MTIPEFNDLSEFEQELMYKAPILVTMLIAGADGKIDNKEIKESISVMTKASKSGPALTAYFDVLSQDIEDKVKILIQSYPQDSPSRTAMIVEELNALNDIFPRLDNTFVQEFYTTLLELARKVASSSGGLLGINAVGQEEEQFLDLPMINPPSVRT